MFMFAYVKSRHFAGFHLVQSLCHYAATNVRFWSALLTCSVFCCSALLFSLF